MKRLVEKLVKEGVLKTSRIIQAFLANDREMFVPPKLAEDAYIDAPLSIGRGQTVSQPYTVAFMLELLKPEPGQKILDIGFGSGWTTAILAKIVGDVGQVFAMEIVPELYEFGKNNLEKFGYRNLKLFNASGAGGLPEFAPFDRILASACALQVPKSWKEQLAAQEGRMVLPVGNPSFCELRSVIKSSKNRFLEKSYPGFAFVPLIQS